MWFSDAPAPRGTLGTSPLAVVLYVAEPNDGMHVWAVSEHSLAPQQREYVDEFGVMPDVLLQSEGYRLGEVAGVVLPEELTSVLGQGPEVLNNSTHPLTPTLVTICDENVMAVSRTFGELDTHVALYRDRWVLVLCPHQANPVLVSTD
jgi:hypothetical protein